MVYSKKCFNIFMLKLIWHPSVSILVLNKSKHFSCQIHRKCTGAHKLQNNTHCCPLSLSIAPSQHIHLALQHQQRCCCINTKPTSLDSHNVSSVFFLVYSFLSVCDLSCSSLFLSKANSTSTGQLDKLGSAGLPALTPESEEERSLPPQRVSTFRPRPYSMADSNKVGNMKSLGGWDYDCS